MGENTLVSFNERSMRDRDAAMPPAPDIPLDDYIAELMECGFTRDQATQYLATLVPLLWHFVNLGFRGDICELFLPPVDSGAVDSNGTSNIEMPSQDRKETAEE